VNAKLGPLLKRSTKVGSTVTKLPLNSTKGGPSYLDSAKQLIDWLSDEEHFREANWNGYGNAFNVREALYRLAVEHSLSPKKDGYWPGFLEMVKSLASTIPDDDLIRALNDCGWTHNGSYWSPPRECQ